MFKRLFWEIRKFILRRWARHELKYNKNLSEHQKSNLEIMAYGKNVDSY